MFNLLRLGPWKEKIHIEQCEDTTSNWNNATREAKNLICFQFGIKLQKLTIVKLNFSCLIRIQVTFYIIFPYFAKLSFIPSNLDWQRNTLPKVKDFSNKRNTGDSGYHLDSWVDDCRHKTEPLKALWTLCFQSCQRWSTTSCSERNTWNLVMAATCDQTALWFIILLA
jgi:hypothetical protein